MKFGRAGWCAASAGALAFILTSEAMSWVLVRQGMSPRDATGYTLNCLIFLGPVGLLAAAVGGLLGQSLHLPGWFGWPLLVGIPSIVNGLAYGWLVEGIVWARTRARALFWPLLLGPALYWALLVFMFLATGRPT